MAEPLPEVDRRRLLEVRGLHPALPVLVLHPLLSIVTGFGRDASDSVVESLGRLGAPLGPAVTGTVEIGGRILELPGALAAVDERPEVVRGPMIVSELGRRRAAAAAIDVSQRAARVSRREAGLARRDQLVDRLEQLSTRADSLERQLESGGSVDASEVERLLIAARLPDPASPNPIITALIDEWEALVAERKAGSGGPTVERAEANLESVRTRIAERNAAIAEGNAPGAEVLDADGVARVQEAHAEVERLASGLEDGRRAERRAAGRDVSAALDAEREALADLGFGSYAAFLLAMAEGRAEDDGAHDAAALLTAESALARARDRESSFVLLSERELDLRARVARLLGRLPGPDVGSELRAGRETIVAPTGARDRLEAVLRQVDVAYGDDPVAAAEQWLADVDTRRARQAALRAELAEIESEGCRLDEQLEMAENELAAAERALIAGVSGSLAGREAPLALSSAEPGELGVVMRTLVAASGPPVVIGECFAELTPQCCAALLEVLGEISRRRQVIIVTEHDAVGRWAQGLGIDGVVWTPIDSEAAQRALKSERAAADDTPAMPAASASDTEPETALDVARPEPTEPAIAAEIGGEPDIEVEVETPEPEAVVETVVETVAEAVAVVETQPEARAPEPEPHVEPKVKAVGRTKLKRNGTVAAKPPITPAPVAEAERAQPTAASLAPPPARRPAPAAPPLFDYDAVEAATAPATGSKVPADSVKNDVFASPEARDAVEAVVVQADATRPAAKRRPTEPAAAPVPGPWKGQPRSRRKQKSQPDPLPWEGRFDTSRERSMPTTVSTGLAAPPGTEPLAVCVRHNGVITRKRCAACKLPACDECLVRPWARRKPICVECAILESGVRMRRRQRG